MRWEVVRSAQAVRTSIQYTLRWSTNEAHLFGTRRLLGCLLAFALEYILALHKGDQDRGIAHCALLTMAKVLQSSRIRYGLSRLSRRRGLGCECECEYFRYSEAPTLGNLNTAFYRSASGTEPGGSAQSDI